MMNFLDIYTVNWNFLKKGLDKNWLKIENVVEIVNNNAIELKCNEETLVDINVYSDDSEHLKSIINTEYLKHSNIMDTDLWELKFLLDVQNDQKELNEKLRQLDLYWSNLEYPESWRGFIYYLPNSNSSSPLDVYSNFLSYLDEAKLRFKNYRIESKSTK